MSLTPLLEVSICADYPAKKGALKDVDFSIFEGDMFGLVGQSGSGKSTISLALLGLLGARGGTARGSVRFRGREILGLRDAELRKLRGREIAFVPQSAIAALNPALKLRAHFREAWRAHRDGSMDETALLRALSDVSLPCEPGFLDRYPSELSVGQGQRILIAQALLHRPSLIIADEPTSSLDVITQADILALFRRANEESGTAMLFISHDLLSVAALCGKIGILNDGELVECGETSQVIHAPRHAYSKRLMAALPKTLQLDRTCAEHA